jgi:3-methylcrotonyl-CoA carboxylase alpha subunit
VEGAVSRAALGVRIGGRIEPVEAPGDAAIESRDGEIRAVSIGGRRVPVRVAAAGGAIHVWCGGKTWEFTAAPPAARGRARGADDVGLRAPMPGRVIRLLVSEGEEVARGATLLILEAMKMEHEIKAPRAGRVAKLPYLVGDQVDAGAPLVEFAG